MRKLILASSFKRAFKSLIRQKPEMEDKIAERLELLVNDPFHPSLKTHKLKGKLSGDGLVLWSMTVE